MIVSLLALAALALAFVNGAGRVDRRLEHSIDSISADGRDVALLMERNARSADSAFEMPRDHSQDNGRLGLHGHTPS